MKMQTNKTYEANPKYTTLMNRERMIQGQIKELQKQLGDVRGQKANTEPYIGK